MILDFVKFINTAMRKRIDWFVEEQDYRDLGMTWMSQGNRGNFTERWLDKFTKNGVCHFMNDDERRIYNQAKLPNYWRFYQELIEYRFNSDGFRAPEFDTIDWKNSYVILGCSHVFGIGNPYQDTIGEFLSKELSAPVINLGVYGAGFEVIYNNFLKQIRTYGKAKGYFFHWSYPNRKINVLNYFYDDDNNYKDYWDRRDEVPGTTSAKEFSDEYLNNQMYKRNIIFHSVREILKDTYYSEVKEPRTWTIHEDKDDCAITVKLPEGIDKGHVDGTWIDYPDEYKSWYINEVCARDIVKYNKYDGPKGSHFGREVNKLLAKYFISEGVNGNHK